MARKRKKKLNIKLIIALSVLFLVFVLGVGFWKFKGLIKRNPDPAYQEAVKLAAAGDYDGAAHEFQRAISFSNRYYPELNVKYRIEFAEMLANRLGEQADLSDELKRSYFGTWIQLLETALRSDPDSQQACDKLLDYWWNARSRGHSDPSIWDKFIEVSDAKIAQNPEDSEIFRKRSVIFGMMASDKEEHFSPAAVSAALAVYCDKNNIEGYIQWLNIAVANRKTKDRDPSLTDGQSSYEALMKTLARIHKDVVEGRDLSHSDQRAIEIISPEDVIAMGMFYNPQSAALKIRAMSLAALRQDEAAKQMYLQQAIEAENKNYDDCVNIADAFMTQVTPASANTDNLLASAEKFYSQAIQLDADNPVAWLGMARVAVTGNQLDRADEFVDKGLATLAGGVPDADIFDPKYKQRDTYHHYNMSLNLLKAQIALTRYGQDDSDEHLAEIESSLAEVDKILPPLQQKVLSGTIRSFQIQAAQLKGRLNMLRGDTYAAEKNLRAIYDAIGADDTLSARLLLQIYIQLKQEAEALRIAKELLTTNPNDTSLLIQQARIQLAIHDVDGLSATMDKLKLMKLSASDAQTFKYLYSQLQIAKNDLIRTSTIPEKIEPSQVTFWLDYASKLAALGEDQQAIKVYNELIKQFPGNVIVLRPLIVLMQQNGQTDQALELIDEHIALKPESKSLKLLRDILTAEEQDRAAIHIAFLESQEESASQQMQLARAYRMNGDEEGYLEHLRKVVELDPEYGGAFDILFDTTLANGNPEEIDALLEKAKQLNLYGVNGDYYRALKLYNDKKYSDALDLVADVINRREYFSLAYSLRGQIQYSLGRTELAKESFQRAWDLSNTNSTAMLALAQIAENQGMDAEHELWIYRCWQHLPMNAYVRYHWLRYQLEKESPEKFVQDCAVVARRYPADDRVKLMLAKGYENLKPAQLQKAESIYTDLYEANKNADNSLEFLKALADFLNSNDRGDEAIELCREALGNSDNPEKIYLLCSQLYRQRSMMAESLEQIKKAMDIAPDDDSVLRAMGQYSLDTHSVWDQGIDAVARLREEYPEEERYFESYFELLLRSGQLERASTELQQVLTGDGQNPMVLAMLGQVAQQSREISKALEYYNRAINIDKQQIRARLLRADVYRQQGRLQQSMEDLQQAYELRPTESMAIMYAQRAREAFPDGSRSREILNDALTRHENSPSLLSALGSLQLAMRDWSLLEQTLRRGRIARPRMSQWYLLEARMWQIRNNELKRADALEKAMELSPDNPTIMLDYISALINSGQSGSVFGLIQKTQTDSIPLRCRLQALSGQAQYKLGQQAAGLNDIRSALLAAPTKSECDFIGTILVDLLDSAPTQALLGKWLEETSAATIGILLSDMKLANTDKRGALEAINAVDISSLGGQMMFEVAYRKGALHYELGEYADALEYYTDALEIAPQSVLVLNNLAYLLSDEMGEHDKAIKYAKAASEAAPMDANIADTLGWINYKAGNVDEAVAELKRSLELRPVPAAYYHLGIIAEAQGQAAQARDYYSKGFDLVKDSPSDNFYADLKEKSGR